MLQEHVAKKLMTRLPNVKCLRKAKGPPSKKPRQDMDAYVTTTDYDDDSNGSTNLLSPTTASTPVQQDDSCDETRMYYNNTLWHRCIENFSKHVTKT